MIHYHGTPITPASVLSTLAGCHFCVSFAHPHQVEQCHRIGQSVMLDNGAFTVWRQGGSVDWLKYYDWSAQWIYFPSTWAVIPDVIDGTEHEQDALCSEWPHGDSGAPVWHVNESMPRLLSLCDNWPKVCFGSAGEYAEVGTARWHERITKAFNEISKRHTKLPWIHMLRGMSLSGSHYPFASVDSTDVARNHNRIGNARAMADRWNSKQNFSRWTEQKEQITML